MIEVGAVIIVVASVGVSAYWVFNHITQSFAGMNKSHADIGNLVADTALKQGKNQLTLENKLRDIEAQIVSLAKDVNQKSVEVVKDEKKST